MVDHAVNLQDHRPPRQQLVINNIQANVTDAMADAPSRDEITARLEAAEARTETRITRLSAAMEAHASAADRKIDLVANKIDGLVSAVSDMKADSKKTREVIWTVGIGAVIAVLGLVITLWIASVNVQANMISVFQTALGVRSDHRETPTAASEAAKGPPAVTHPSPAPPEAPPVK